MIRAFECLGIRVVFSEMNWLPSCVYPGRTCVRLRLLGRGLVISILQDPPKVPAKSYKKNTPEPKSNLFGA